jgi:hypothetical protein
VSSRNKLSSVTTFDEFWRHNTRELGYDKDAQETSRQHKTFTGLIWESVLTDAVIFRSQAGVARANSHNSPDSCHDNPGGCDFIAATKQTFPKSYTYGNAINHSASNADFFQFINRLEFFLNSKSLGEHDVQLKDNLMLQRDVNWKSEPGDRLFELNGPDKLALTTYYSNDPRFEDARYGWFITNTNSLRNALTLSDAWRPSRYLTLTPGAAFTMASAANSRGDEVFAGQALTPSLSVAWDATHDGRTVLRGSVAEYLDVELTTIAGHTLGSQVSKRCLWNPDTQAYDRTCVFSGGATSSTIASPCGPSGVDVQGNDCHGQAEDPPDLGVHRGLRARGDPGPGARHQRRLPQVQQPVRDHGDQPHLERPRHRRGVLPGRPPAHRDGPRDPRGRQPALRRRHRLGGQARGAPEDAGRLHLEPPRRHRARRQQQPLRRHRARATPSSTARCPTTTGTSSRPTSATAPPRGSASAPATRTSRARPTTASSATTSPATSRTRRRPSASTPGTNVNDPTDDRELRLPDQHSPQRPARLQPPAAHRHQVRDLRRRAQRPRLAAPPPR